jgi:hypothetical protein
VCSRYEGLERLSPDGSARMARCACRSKMPSRQGDSGVSRRTRSGACLVSHLAMVLQMPQEGTPAISNLLERLRVLPLEQQTVDHLAYRLRFLN